MATEDATKLRLSLEKRRRTSPNTVGTTKQKKAKKNRRPRSRKYRRKWQNLSLLSTMPLDILLVVGPPTLSSCPVANFNRSVACFHPGTSSVYRVSTKRSVAL
ncbi:hypothetical protein ARMGADRAFT_223421 [Armillaria gallica]|uniref:Uncharacterized protein n=1 Tax=Armillaria gallica TaxID=47427 RepID=A0A2H3ESC1_ARMGA|nr:hypothetical protein ARMGADRAFT_223421 [Armillaria gallica]